MTEIEGSAAVAVGIDAAVVANRRTITSSCNAPRPGGPGWWSTTSWSRRRWRGWNG